MSEENTGIPAEAVDTSPVDDSATAESTEEGSPATPVETSPVKIEQKLQDFKKKLKLKVDDEEYEEEIDWNDEEGLRKKLQYSKVAQKRMQEKATLEKEVNSFIDELRKNPRKVLSDPRLSVDLKKMAAEIIEEEIAQSQKSPEQIEKEELQARLKELQDERKKEKELARDRELEDRTEREMQNYDNMMTKALSNSDLPKTPYVVKKMADYMLSALQNDIALTPEDVVPMIREEMQNDLREMFATMPDEIIEGLVGKEVFNRVRKKNVLKAKAQVPPVLKAQIKDTGTKAPTKDASPKKTVKEFFGM